VVSDDVIELCGKMKEAYPRWVRFVMYYDKEPGKTFEFITNQLKLPARTIADIYKSRWLLAYIKYQVCTPFSLLPGSDDKGGFDGSVYRCWTH